MHILATLVLTLTLTGPALAPPPLRPLDQQPSSKTHPSGKWYLAENGHAVYCYGPVLMVKQPEGTLQRVATFCKGEKTMVPLRD
jgi:hypothetical protein